MEDKRPKIQIPMTRTDIIIELISFITVILMAIITIISVFSLPDIIPTHFNFQGNIDRYGSKSGMIVVLIITLLIYTGLTLLVKFPQIYNYAVEITKENAEVQYRLAKKFIRFLKLEIVMLFSYLNIMTILAASNRNLSLGSLFLPVVMLIIFGTIGIYIYKSIKSR